MGKQTQTFLTIDYAQMNIEYQRLKIIKAIALGMRKIII